jgi:hypothetical protein
MLRLVQKRIRDKKLFVQGLKVGQEKEVERQEKDGVAVDFSVMKSKGLGDTIEKITKATGIKKVVEKLPGDCGCKKRKDALNKAFPYKK